MLSLCSLLLALIAAVLADNATIYRLPSQNGGNTIFRFRDQPANVEPLNVIVEMPAVPFLNATAAVTAWLAALQLSDECLGLHLSGVAEANLGDGQGFKRLDFLYRENFGDAQAGTCRQTVVGGLHLRAWRQYLKDSDSDTMPQAAVWFFGASQEEDLERKHTISPNGYDAGRDAVARRAQAPFQVLNNTRTFSAQVSQLSGVQKQAVFNHNITSDGTVTLIRVSLPVALPVVSQSFAHVMTRPASWLLGFSILLVCICS